MSFGFDSEKYKYLQPYMKLLLLSKTKCFCLKKDDR